MIKKVSLAILLSVVGFGSAAHAVRINVPCPTVEDLGGNRQLWVRTPRLDVDPHRPGGVPAAPTHDTWTISVPASIHNGAHTIGVRWIGNAQTDTAGHPPIIKALEGIGVRPDGMLECKFRIQNPANPERAISYFTIHPTTGRFDHCVVAGPRSFTCTYSD